MFVITVSLACCPPAERGLETACPIWWPWEDVPVVAWERRSIWGVRVACGIYLFFFLWINKYITVRSWFLSLSLLFLCYSNFCGLGSSDRKIQSTSRLRYGLQTSLHHAGCAPLGVGGPKKPGPKHPEQSCHRRDVWGQKPTSTQCLGTTLVGRPVCLNAVSWRSILSTV